jgi:hypothetical protein
MIFLKHSYGGNMAGRFLHPSADDTEKLSCPALTQDHYLDTHNLCHQAK